MPQILVRDLKEQTVNRLKARARKKGRSLQAEVKEILDESARMEMEREAAWKRLDAIRKSFGNRRFDDSTLIIRKDRDWLARRHDER